MSMASEDDERIADTASRWLAERNDGLSSARTREFQRWCLADPRHAAAVARLEAACAILEEMPRVRAELQPVVGFPAARPMAVRGPSRPAWWSLVAGLAAIVCLTALGWWQWPGAISAVESYTTSAGGFERVVLADGSVVELNADTAVHVAFARNERRVVLMSGEAHFAVAPDAARPFIVSAGDVSVRAVGTAFNVRLATAAVEVLVTEGRVAVARPTDPASLNDRRPRGSNPRASVSQLHAYERLVIPNPVPLAQTGLAPPVVERISPEMVRTALAWQERKLVFADTPLREVVGQFNRRNRLQLVIADPALDERPVGGTFAADNAEGFVRLLEGSRTIVVERRGEFEILLRAAP